MKRYNSKNKNKLTVLKVAAIGAATYIAKELLDDIKPHIKEASYTTISKSIKYGLYTPGGIALANYLYNLNIPYLNNSMIRYYDDLGEAKFNGRDGKCIFYKNGCIYYVSVYDNSKDGISRQKCKVDIIGINSNTEMNNILEYREMRDRSRVKSNRYTRSGASVGYIIDNVSFDDILSSSNNHIISILDRFQTDTEYYKKLKLPHKTGILLYGEPGTGKTTMAKAIASYMNYSLLTVNVSDIDDKFLEYGKNKTVVLFEDIDCEIESREGISRIKTGDNKSIPITDLLNILDGVNSPGDCIFVATTNYYDRLDPAIKRSGRFDHHIELGKLDHDLAVKMCHKFEVDPDKVLEGVQIPINPSDLQRHILEYRRLHM